VERRAQSYEHFLGHRLSQIITDFFYLFRYCFLICGNPCNLRIMFNLSNLRTALSYVYPVKFFAENERSEFNRGAISYEHFLGHRLSQIITDFF
jgi:hypothetical protein